MDKILISDATKSNFLGHFVVELFAQIKAMGSKEGLKAEDLVANHGTPDAHLNIEIKIGGREVSFIEFADHLEKQFDRCVAEEANKMFEKRLNDLINPLEWLLEECKTEARKRLNLPEDD